jgi:type VI protein secretion system component Hcp
MIVAKFLNARQPFAAGSCNIRGYEHGGWLPLDSFSFGLDAEHKESSAKKGNGGMASQDQSGPARPGSHSPSNGATLPGDDDTEHSTLSISKQVDMASCDLMHRAMCDRIKRTKCNDSLITVDIHLLSSVEIKKANKTVANVFPCLLIRLEGVVVKNWNVEGDGDNRPTESLTLVFDRAAMQYVHTKDGERFMPLPVRGWDQSRAQSFDYNFSAPVGFA